MMTLIFSLFLVAFLIAGLGRLKFASAVFMVSLALSVYWFAHHATDRLQILL